MSSLVGAYTLMITRGRSSISQSNINILPLLSETLLNILIFMLISFGIRMATPLLEDVPCKKKLNRYNLFSIGFLSTHLYMFLVKMIYLDNFALTN